MSNLTDFVNNLSRTGAGRNLQQHLRNVESRCESTFADCPRIRISLLRRTLLHGIANGRLFGLPEKLPKVIGLFDCSGCKSLLFSETNMLLTAAITGFSPQHDRDRHLRELDTLIRWAEEHRMGFLVFGVLPWQAGLGWLSFEIRTFCQKDGVVHDGQKIICDHLIGVRDAQPTFSSSDSPVGGKEVRALQDTVSAVSVDGDGGALAPVTGENKKNVMFEETARRLGQDLKDLRAKIAKDKEEEEDRVLKATAKKEAAAVEKHVQAARLKEACEKKIAASDEEVRKALAAQIAAEQTTAEAVRTAAEASLRLKESEEALKKQKKLAATASATASRQLSDLRAQVQELQKQRTQTSEVQKTEEAMRASAAREVLELKQKVADHAETIGKLAEVVDRTENEKAAVHLQLKETEAALSKSTASKKRVDVAKKQTEARIAELTAELAEAKAQADRNAKQLAETKGMLQAETARSEAQKKRLEEEIERAVAAERRFEQSPTGPTSSRRSTDVQTCSIGTGTTTVASTQTDPMEEDPQPLSNAEIAKAAHRALNRLCEVAQMPQSQYKPSFRNHIPPRAFHMPLEFSDS